MEQVVTFLYNRNKYEEIIINCSDTCKKSTNSWLQICAQMDNYSFAWKNISSVQVKVINYFQILTFPKMWLPPLKKKKHPTEQQVVYSSCFVFQIKRQNPLLQTCAQAFGIPGKL